MQITTELTPKIHFNGTRRRVLTAIVQHHDQHGLVPRVKDIAEASGLLAPAVSKELKHMRRDHWLEYTPGRLQKTLRLSQVVAAAFESGERTPVR